MMLLAGWWHSLGLKANGSIVAWGWNGYGQCNVPSPNTDFVAIAAGEDHSLGLKADGSIVAWGENYEGQCNVPSSNMGFTAIAAGAYHSLGLKQDGYLVVPWGNNYDSQCDVPSNLLKIPIIERYSYDVFGKPTIQDANGVVLTASAFGNPYMFTGRYYDTETGNYYYRARMYSPKLGRFLQTDPIGYRGGINLYTYCGNNSLNFTDPYGLVGLNDSPLISTDPELASKNFEFYTAGGSGKTSSLSEYIDEVCTLPWNIGEEAKRIEKEEFPGYADPFGGDYRHFLAGGMAARNCGLAGGAIGILWMGDSHEVYWKRETNVGSDMRYDAEAEWRGYREALMHPFTSLRELGKYNTVRPIGSKIIKQGN